MGVVIVRFELVVLLNSAFESASLLEYSLRLFNIVPEPRLLGFRIEAFGLFFGVIYVKDTS